MGEEQGLGVTPRQQGAHDVKAQCRGMNLVDHFKQFLGLHSGEVGEPSLFSGDTVSS